MHKLRVRLLALDLDGTLLEAGSTLSAANREAVARAQAMGLQVVLVTGRSWRSTHTYYEALGLTGPAICYLGALVVADGSGRIAYYRPLVQPAWEQLRDFALANRLAVTAAVGVDQAVADGDLPGHGLVAADIACATRKADDFSDWEGWNPYTEIHSDLSPCKAPPVMVAVYGDQSVRSVLAEFSAGLPQSQFDLTDRIAGETVLHVWHAQVDKGRALADFCRAHGIRPGEVAAIGDAPMDISMIKYAGLGVAVPNGHPALKAAAGLIATPSEAIDLILKEGRTCAD